MISKQAALADLLIALFSSEELRRLLLRSPELEVLRAELPEGSLVQEAHEVVVLLERRGDDMRVIEPESVGLPEARLGPEQ